MNREQIESILRKKDSTVLSFPDRNNEWGDSKYRGNCSGWIHAFLIWKYNVTRLAELFAGSGTGYDVAKDMQIAYSGADLNPTPVRPGILNVNCITDEVPDEFYNADMIFMHPPYGKEIGIPYAGSQYLDPSGELSKYDLGQMPWPQFIKALNEVVVKYFTAMQLHGRMAILMGDVRRNGQLYSMLTDIVKLGKLEQIIIKMQHNCVSEGRTYTNKNFVPIVHEYIMVLKKIAPYLIHMQVPISADKDIRDSVKTATWKDILAAVFRKYNRPLSLNELYSEICMHKRCQTNPHYREKIRQTLYVNSLFTQTKDGMWAISA